MAKKKLLLVGAGGFGRMVAEQAMLQYDCAFVDDGQDVDTEICGIPVVGGIADLPELIEHEVCFLAVLVQLRRGGIQIILVDFFNIQCRAGLILPIPDVFQVVAQGGSYHALGTCD